LPLYEYRCTQCGHDFEKIQHFNSKPETKCPECGGTLQRPLAAPALKFKGTGWYVTDYGSKSAVPAGKVAPPEKLACAAKCAAGATCPAAAAAHSN
jgi:putative FmdB family regulatory protein